MKPPKAEYALGHSAHEISRLQRQGDYFSELTRELFIRAGISEGMQVLDFGGGAGDVAFVAADLVGRSGKVVSFDRSADAVSKGAQRSMEQGLKTLRFVQADEHTIRDTIGDMRFDAVVGRLVLVFQPDPVATLRTLMSYAKPSGIVAFHEYDQEATCWSQPTLALFEKVYTWIIDAFRQGGMVTDAGKVARVFRSAGLQSLRIVREGQVSNSSDPIAHQFLVDIVRTMLPLAEKRGGVTADFIKLDTLLDNLVAESSSVDAHWIAASLIAAWGRVPT